MNEATMYNAELIPDLLGPGGSLSRAVGAFEDRPYQREMSLEVARLLEEGGCLAIEAPTGIGKSLAYGLPAAAWSRAGNGPVIVSTHTKALQEQLLTKEAPRLKKALGTEVAVRIQKGRSNYLCRRRYKLLCGEAKGPGTLELLERISPWVEKTETGDLGEIGWLAPRDRRFLELQVTSDPRFCSHSGCTPHQGCFFKLARARAATADILIVNHALLAIHFFSDLALLPRFETLIVDEAHGFVRVALDHLTVSLGPLRVTKLVEGLPGAGGFLPSFAREGETESWLAAVQRSTKVVETAGRQYFGKKNGSVPTDDPRQRYRDRDEFQRLCPLSSEPLDHSLGTLLADTHALETCASRKGEERGGAESLFLSQIRRFKDEAQSIREDLGVLTAPDFNEQGTVHWKEWSGDRGFSIKSAPLYPGTRLHSIWKNGPETTFFTSATLAAGDDFSYFAREVGLPESLPSVAYPSPFDFEKQSLAIAIQNGPDPRDQDWAESTAGTLRALMQDPGLKTMALFTSYRDLTRVQKHLGSGDPQPKAGEAFALLVQGDGATAGNLLESFRDSRKALLLGTASFWEGVDLPGDDLEILVLTRLPFGVPTDPRFQARAERLEAEGGNPFKDLYLPEAILRFKQGFGRLIRRQSDRGIVAVLDPRLLSRGYGKRFAAALPLEITPAKDGSALAAAAAAWWAVHGRRD